MLLLLGIPPKLIFWKKGGKQIQKCRSIAAVFFRYHIVGDYAVGEHLDNNPLVNLTQLPMGGIWQVVFTIMCLEWLTTYVCKPPAEKPWDILGWTDILIEDEKGNKVWMKLLVKVQVRHIYTVYVLLFLCISRFTFDTAVWRHFDWFSQVFVIMLGLSLFSRCLKQVQVISGGSG